MSLKDIDPSVGSAVAAALVQLSCQNWQLLSAKRLSGGAINQNFLIELQDEQAQTIRWVMRRARVPAFQVLMAGLTNTPSLNLPMLLASRCPSDCLGADG